MSICLLACLLDMQTGAPSGLGFRLTRRDETRRYATQRNATQRNATQRNATQRNATQRNATQPTHKRKHKHPPEAAFREGIPSDDSRSAHNLDLGF